jgi:hypothetical protein
MEVIRDLTLVIGAHIWVHADVNPLYDKRYVNNILNVGSNPHEESVSIRKVSRLMMIMESSTIYSKNKTNSVVESCVI